MKTLITLFALSLSLVAHAATNLHSVTLAWNPNPEPDIAAYVVYYGLGSRSYVMATNVGNVTTATVHGLSGDNQWFFAITAVNTTGLESDFSNEVKTKIPGAPTAPTITTNYLVIPPSRWEVVIKQMP